jgi:hypothetical protein
MRLRTARLVSLAALLPLLACAVAGIGYDRFRCVFTGEVSEDDGCCPAEDASATAVMKGAPCCERETAQHVHPPVEPTTPAVDYAAAPAQLSLGTPLGPLPARRLAAAADAPRPPPAPLHLLKQSFLI